MKKSQFYALAIIWLVCVHREVAATVLTFEQDPPVFNFELVRQSYGDRVTATMMPGNILYGEGGEGFTPNVVVRYLLGAQLENEGFGDLSLVLTEDIESGRRIMVEFQADEGYRVRLHGWDMAAFGGPQPDLPPGDPVIKFVRVTDGLGNELFRRDQVAISTATHTSFDFGPNPLAAQKLTLDSVTLSLPFRHGDFVFGIDNIVFSQQAIPEPNAWILMVAPVFSAIARRPGRIKLV